MRGKRLANLISKAVLDNIESWIRRHEQFRIYVTRSKGERQDDVAHFIAASVNDTLTISFPPDTESVTLRFSRAGEEPEPMNLRPSAAIHLEMK